MAAVVRCLEMAAILVIFLASWNYAGADKPNDFLPDDLYPIDGGDSSSYPRDSQIDGESSETYGPPSGLDHRVVDTTDPGTWPRSIRGYLNRRRRRCRRRPCRRLSRYIYLQNQPEFGAPSGNPIDRDDSSSWSHGGRSPTDGGDPETWGPAPPPPALRNAGRWRKYLNRRRRRRCRRRPCRRLHRDGYYDLPTHFGQPVGGDSPESWGPRSKEFGADV